MKPHKLCYFIPLLALLSCCSTVEPEPEPPPMVDARFEAVPVEWMSRDPAIYEAWDAVADATPPDTIWWQLDYYLLFGWIKAGEGMSLPGERAGHRWYVEKRWGLPLRLVAWTRRAVDTATVRVER